MNVWLDTSVGLSALYLSEQRGFRRAIVADGERVGRHTVELCCSETESLARARRA